MTLELAAILPIATILIVLCEGAAIVLYAAPIGYMGHRRVRSSGTQSMGPYIPPSETVAPAAASVAAEQPGPTVSTPQPMPAIYESVQPTLAPVTYAPPVSTPSATHLAARKPQRTQRRKKASIKRTATARNVKARPKKR